MLLVRTNSIQKHASSDTIEEFEKIILADPNSRKAPSFSFFFHKFCHLSFRIFRKIGIPIISKTKRRYLCNPFLDKGHLFVVMMGLDVLKFRTYCLLTSHNRSIYLFDALPLDYDKIIDFTNTYKIDYLFISASQSASYLKKKINSAKVFWIPEGINATDYKYYSIENKTIDVLALGRKYDLYHDEIVNFCTQQKLIYLFEKIKGELIFPTRNDFIEGLASSKISICVPSSITHPSRSGGVETMTIRYLQSMASKCLVLGHAPSELIDLFGYNPVIEIDKENPTSQINNILKNYADYLPLIEKNYKTVILNHTWVHRWNKIKEIYSVNSITKSSA